MEDTNEITTFKIHEYSYNEVSFCEQVESNDVLYTIDDNAQGDESSEVSACKQLQTTSSIVYNTERRRSSEDLNNLDKKTLSVGSKGSNKIAGNNKLDVDNIYNRTTSLGSKSADTVVSDKPNLESSKYIKRSLRSKRRVNGNLTGGKTLFSTAAKRQGLPALRRKNDETHCFGSEKNALTAVLVSIKYVHQLRLF